MAEGYNNIYDSQCFIPDADGFPRLHDDVISFTVGPVTRVLPTHQNHHVVGFSRSRNLPAGIEHTELYLAQRRDRLIGRWARCDAISGAVLPRGLPGHEGSLQYGSVTFLPVSEGQYIGRWQPESDELGAGGMWVLTPRLGAAALYQPQ